jgi:hypothetical protein
MNVFVLTARNFSVPIGDIFHGKSDKLQVYIYLIFTVMEMIKCHLVIYFIKHNDTKMYGMVKLMNRLNV